eukprot:evm.model.scf_818.6 EVM.evm.TU.scf_818.6   scf_818:24592-31196(+)
MDVGWMWYAYLFLVLELTGSASIIGYALILMRTVSVKPRRDAPTIQNDYVVRVFVPCYKEDLEIVQATVMAAIDAELPPNCTKHVYLCDDGRDPAKQTWCEEISRRWSEGWLHYCRRPRTKGELNGKAANLNFTLRRIYESSASRYSRTTGFRRAHGAEQDPEARDMFLNEVVAVFDADMVCKSKFFMKTLPILDTCDMVLTPQWFYNVPLMADIFNHANLHLWEYMLPSMDGWGCLSCTGTNFVIRASALSGVGYFPTYTVTEDYALSLELGRHGYKTRYLPEYLAEGEAPEEVSNIFKQRHRWCTGHLQVFFGKRNPIFYPGLSLKMRVMYSLGAYSYMCAAFLTPLFLLAPILAIWFGIFPIDLNRHYPLAFTIYYGMTLFTVYYSRTLKHLIFLWFASNANLVLWYTYANATLSVFMSLLSCGRKKIKFEVTDKTGPSARKGMTSSMSTSSLTSMVSSGSLAGLSYNNPDSDPVRRHASSCGSLADMPDTPTNGANGRESPAFADEPKRLHISIPVHPIDPLDETKKPLLPVSETRASAPPRRSGCTGCVCSIYEFFRDTWVALITLALCVGSIYAGIWLGLGDRHTVHIQMVSILWCGYNAIAPFLVIYYALFNFRGLRGVCCLMAGFSIVALVAVLYSLHVYYRDVYDYTEVLDKSLWFYEAQRSGLLPASNRVPWRGDSGLFDFAPSGTDLIGGYYDAGDTIKFGLPAAVSMSFLAWGMIEFPSSFADAGQKKHMQATLKWGTDYFIKAHTGPEEFVAQVGNGTWEHTAKWGRPEDVLAEGQPGVPRVGWVVNATNPGSDVVGSTAAAMAATAVVFKSVDTTYSHLLLKHAKELYAFGVKRQGLYSDSIIDAQNFYNSTTYHDDLAWGAMWLHYATGEEKYLKDAEKHIKPLIAHLPYTTNWDNVGHAVVLLLHRAYPHNTVYKNSMEKLMDRWIFEFQYTPKKLAWATPWGPDREAANTAMIAMIYADAVEKQGGSAAKYGAYRCWAMFQIRFMLGEYGRSLVTGFGYNPPTHVHHMAASCPDLPSPCGWAQFHSNASNPQTLYGALVGGPDLDGVYNDTRDNYVQNEVSLDYNAGFTGAVAGVMKMDSYGKCYWGGGVFRFFKAVAL